MSWFDLRSEFFRPMWRRIAVVALCLGWTVVEFVAGSPFWGMLFGGIGLFAAYQFFLQDWPERPSD